MFASANFFIYKTEKLLKHVNFSPHERSPNGFHTLEGKFATKSTCSIIQYSYKFISCFEGKCFRSIGWNFFDSDPEADEKMLSQRLPLVTISLFRLRNASIRRVRRASIRLQILSLKKHTSGNGFKSRSR